MNSKKGFVTMSTVLLAVLLLIGVRTYSVSANKAEKAHEAELLNEEARDYGILKEYLTGQVDSLKTVYDNLVAHYHSSRNLVEELNKNEAVPRKVNSVENEYQEIITLKSNVEDLLEMKETLEFAIAELQSKK